MDILFFVLLVVFIVLSIKTIKVQNKRIESLEGFVKDYLGGKDEQLQKRDSERVSRVAETNQG